MYLCPGSHKRQGHTCLRAWFKCHPSHKQSLNLQLESCDSPVPSSHSPALRTVLYLVIFVIRLSLPKAVNSLKADVAFSSHSCLLRLGIHATAFLIYNKNRIFFFWGGVKQPQSLSGLQQQRFTSHSCYIGLWLVMDLFYGFQAERATPNITSHDSPTRNPSKAPTPPPQRARIPLADASHMPKPGHGRGSPLPPPTGRHCQSYGNGWGYIILSQGREPVVVLTILSLSLFSRWGDWGREKLHNWPRLT